MDLKQKVISLKARLCCRFPPVDKVDEPHKRDARQSTPSTDTATVKWVSEVFNITNHFAHPQFLEMKQRCFQHIVRVARLPHHPTLCSTMVPDSLPYISEIPYHYYSRANPQKGINALDPVVGEMDTAGDGQLECLARLLIWWPTRPSFFSFADRGRGAIEATKLWGF